MSYPLRYHPISRLHTLTLVFGLLHAVHQRLHPRVVQTVRLHHVNYVDPVLLVLPRVRDQEVEPLDVPVRLVVRLQDQVVLKFVSKFAKFTSGSPGAGSRFRTDFRKSASCRP
jgi:hypothetical protein